MTDTNRTGQLNAEIPAPTRATVRALMRRIERLEARLEASRAPKARARREIETIDQVEMVRRLIRSLGTDKRVGGGDDFHLTALISLRGTLEETIDTAIRGQRRNRAASWASIGDALGVTKSAAYQRYGSKE